MNFLLDTNIAISLDPLRTDGLEERTAAVVDLSRLAAEGGHRVFVHPSSMLDIARDTNELRREARTVLFKKYMDLASPPDLPAEAHSIVGTPAQGTNDWVDNQLLSAILGNAADYLVTDDDGIHRKALRLGIADRVVTAADAVLLLKSLEAVFVPLPRVDPVVAYELDSNDAIFDSIREEYGQEFDPWLEKVQRDHRPCLVVRDAEEGVQALAVLKHDDDEFGMTGRVLKLSTFKVSEEHRGNRYGELLLHAVIRYARDHGFDAIWVSAFTRHAALVALFENMGFFDLGAEKQPGEGVYGKRLTWTANERDQLEPVEFNRTFGPGAVKVDDVSLYLAPIRPEFHKALFPEGEEAPPLFVEAFGNAVRKAYLSNANTRSISPGDVLLFYRSEDSRSVSAVGVVESVFVATDPVAIQQHVGNRTVYSTAQIADLCQREVLVILFRFDRMLHEPISYEELLDHDVVASAPQTTMQSRPGGLAWLKSRIQA